MSEPTRGSDARVEDLSQVPVAHLYRSIRLIRRAEEEVARIYPSDRIKSPVHLSIGQEAIAAAVCCALRPDDVVFGTYRSHATYLAKGGDVRGFFAELYGKVTGCARGKGGSMHMIDPSHGILGTSAVVGTTIPHAVGYAWALRQRGSDAVVACFFGDGATEEGVFAESLNLARLKEVPVLFICENNQLAIHSRIEARQAAGQIWERARVVGIESMRIERSDTIRLFHAARDAIASMRSGGGPSFIEAVTYRWKEHVGPGDDWSLGYRSADEAEPWMADDQMVRVGDLLGADLRERIDREVEATIVDAIAFAEASPFPGPGELYADLYREEVAWSAR